MTSAVRPMRALVLEPAAAPLRPGPAGDEALQRALDHDALQGRDAVRRTEAASPTGRRVDRYA